LPAIPTGPAPESRTCAPPVATTAFKVSLAVQGLAFLVLVFGDIGFDKPGRFGLDFGHYLLLIAIWLVATCVGLFAAFRGRSKGAVMLQSAVTLASAAWGLTH
jgi:hypothetical protein